MFELIRSDLMALCGGGGLLRKIKIGLTSHSFHLSALFRAGAALRSLPSPIGPVMGWGCEYLIRVIYASDISCKATIGPKLFIAHGHDIVIGSGVKIGSSCKIFNGVTLGNRDTESGFNSQPSVGDDCVLSTGSKILGGIRLGDRCVVGANAVVIADVPDDSVAVGVPARVLKAKSTRCVLEQ